MSDTELAKAPIREAIEYASSAARVAVSDGLLLDNLFLFYLLHFDYVSLLKRIKISDGDSRLRAYVSSERLRKTTLQRDTAVSIAAQFVAEFSQAAVACLRVYEERPDVVAALRLAADRPAKLVNDYFAESYFDASVEFARQRCICFVPEPNHDALMIVTGGAADLTDKYAKGFDRHQFATRFDDIARHYVEWVDLRYCGDADRPSDHLGEDKFRIAIKKEAQRATYLLFPSETLKAVREARPCPSPTSETMRVLELLRSGEKPGVVAARLGKSAGAVRQIKSRAKRRGMLDS